jgi:hypothetical protein
MYSRFEPCIVIQYGLNFFFEAKPKPAIMPSSLVIENGFNPDAKCMKPTETFSGDVLLDPIHMGTDAASAYVIKSWRINEKGEMINVVARIG